MEPTLKMNKGTLTSIVGCFFLPNKLRCPLMPTKPQEVLSLLLFVALSCYVAFSAVRLGTLLWQRFA